MPIYNLSVHRVLRLFSGHMEVGTMCLFALYTACIVPYLSVGLRHNLPRLIMRKSKKRSLEKYFLIRE